jgi:hypothetical protein
MMNRRTLVLIVGLVAVMAIVAGLSTPTVPTPS